MSLLISAFNQMSNKTLILKEQVEQMLKCDICYCDMPYENNNLGDSGFDDKNGHYSVSVKMNNRNGRITPIEEVEEVFTHEILHARQYALGFPTIYADNVTISEISLKLGDKNNPDPLVGIRNLSSILGHIEMIPIMMRLGYSIDKHLGEKLKSVLASKAVISQIVSSKGTISDYDYEILCANCILQLIEVYLFYNCDIKRQLENIHPIVGENLKLLSRKLNIGVVRDAVTEGLQFTEFIDIDKCDNNCTRLLNFTGLSGKKLYEIKYKNSSRVI